MPDEKLQNMTLQDAEAELSKRVYAATRLIEELEFAGHVRGNGHHIRQEIAAFAVKLLREQWEESNDRRKYISYQAILEGAEQKTK